ncbi:MAG TPA: universal stress protein [Thermomicrobiales bacterium]
MTATPKQLRILVPLDGSPLAEQALPYARVVAGEAGEIVLLTVVPWAEDVRNLLGKIVIPAPDLQASYESSAREELEDVRKRWFGDRPGVSIEIRAGDPAEHILWAADAVEANLIVMASHGRGALGRWTFGSVADRVSRASTIPVLIIHPREIASKPEDQPVIERVVMLTDGSPLSLQAIPVAANLGQTLGVPVHALRAIDPNAMVTHVPLAPTPLPVSFEDAVAQAQEDAERSVKTAVEQLRAAGATADGEIVQGPIGLSLIEAIRPTDIVVMTTHGRSGVSRWLLGSMAEKMIRAGVAPVVVVPSSVRTEETKPAVGAQASASSTSS